MKKLTKKQYKNLINALFITNTIYAILKDLVDPGYKKKLKEFEDLEEKILQQAEQYGMESWVRDFEGKRIIKEEKWEEPSRDLFRYEEYTFWEELARRFARREIEQKYTEEQLKQMDEQQFLSELFVLEEEYWKEFQKHGLDRITFRLGE